MNQCLCDKIFIKRNPEQFLIRGRT